MQRSEQVSRRLLSVAILSQDGRIPHDVHFVDLSEALVSPRYDDFDPFLDGFSLLQASRIVVCAGSAASSLKWTEGALNSRIREGALGEDRS